MRVKCIDNVDRTTYLSLGKIYEVISTDGEYILVNTDRGFPYWFVEERFEVYQEPTQIIDLNGIQTEPFTHEEKKVIAVEKDLAKARIWYKLLNEFKTANDLQRIALLEIFEEMGYPKTDMVKLYRVIADES